MTSYAVTNNNPDNMNGLDNSCLQIYLAPHVTADFMFRVRYAEFHLHSTVVAIHSKYINVILSSLKEENKQKRKEAEERKEVYIPPAWTYEYTVEDPNDRFNTLEIVTPLSNLFREMYGYSERDSFYYIVNIRNDFWRMWDFTWLLINRLFASTGLIHRMVSIYRHRVCKAFQLGNNASGDFMYPSCFIDMFKKDTPLSINSIRALFTVNEKELEQYPELKNELGKHLLRILKFGFVDLSDIPQKCMTAMMMSTLLPMAIKDEKQPRLTENHGNMSAHYNMLCYFLFDHEKNCHMCKYKKKENKEFEGHMTWMGPGFSGDTFNFNMHPMDYGRSLVHVHSNINDAIFYPINGEGNGLLCVNRKHEAKQANDLLLRIERSRTMDGVLERSVPAPIPIDDPTPDHTPEPDETTMISDDDDDDDDDPSTPLS